MNRWNDIAISLKECQAGNLPEKDYQPKVEDQFKLLGWSVYYGCIESRPRLETANTIIIPDIVLKKDGVRVLPIELKKPANHLKKKNAKQLFSYMRQLELRVGIYIGEKIQLYYNSPNDTSNPHSVLSTSLSPDSPEGELFCDLLSYESFDLGKLEAFCAERLQIINYKAKLANELNALSRGNQLEAFLKGILKAHYMQEGCVDVPTLDQEIEKIVVKAEYGSSGNERSSMKKSAPRKISKYTLNGSSPMNMRTLVLEALRLFVKKYPNATYEEIETTFNIKELPGGYKTVRRLSDINQGMKAGGLSGRYFIGDNQILKSADKIESAVSNQWSYHNFPFFLTILKKFNFSVKKV